MTPAPFDVVVVPFPYSDILQEKRRPALVVSASLVADRTGLVWVAMITTSATAAYGDCDLSDLDAAGLSVPCKVRASKLATLDAARILRRAGALSSADRDRARAALSACAAF